MAPRQYSFQFARVSIIGRQITTKEVFFDNLFAVNKQVSGRDNKYMFLDVQKVIYNQEIFYAGRLVKYKARDEEVVIEDSRAIGLSTIEDAVVAKPEFILHAYSGIIAFRPVPSRFSAIQFREKFARLVEASFDNFFISTKVETVNEDFEIQEQFRRFRTIHSITVEIHPSNPHNRDLWERIDNEIKELDATEYQQRLIGGLSGLNKEKVEQSDIFLGIMMASDGYGHASIDGVLEDGRRITVTTADNPTEAKTTIDGDPEHLIKQLIRTFQLVWKRTKK
jgi:hypothetical protein